MSDPPQYPHQPMHKPPLNHPFDSRVNSADTSDSDTTMLIQSQYLGGN